jgi:hypothetical protein
MMHAVKDADIASYSSEMEILVDAIFVDMAEIKYSLAGTPNS